ncbi:putative nucleotide sugar epimerase/dehydratase [Methanocella paludicola SANAE]|uniref:Nucleotide sugar epimerase/dehydratase n=1 Tax=Methanocella paludicola (strain DSM 17711 / JCM 13418 / NBRC 101707 / SANAE) TaxID=304371 RepID=D1YWM3_METPS|nr:GDP-mannose 4,6-dehydratase [Methanocella paludicola]BAI60845.1 putative nucleotide sugar epimerase/dehydratase [Methanocella paludicola SANAE]
MNILITGGAGFVGSHLCDKYTLNGDKVICLDNFMNGSLTNIRHLIGHRNFKLINGDIRNFDLLEKIMRDVDVVFHLAAQIHVDRSVVEPKLTYDINVIGTQNVLEAARMYDVQKVIHASTSEVYGSTQYAPMDEDHPLNAPHPYGASKIAADRLCFSYINTYGMNICIMRPFNLYGPRQKDTGYGGAISIFTKRVLNNMPPIIFGDGEQTRDYTYVEDIVEAYDLILHHEGRMGQPMNFGTGNEIKILDLARLIIKMCGKEGQIKPVCVEPRPGEVVRLIADISRAKSVLGWKPHYSIEMGLGKYLDWYANYKCEEWSKPT